MAPPIKPARWTATRILDEARQRGMQIGQLAAAMHYTPQYLYAVTKGREKISETFVRRACAALDVEPEAIFTPVARTPNGVETPNAVEAVA